MLLYHAFRIMYPHFEFQNNCVASLGKAMPTYMQLRLLKLAPDSERGPGLTVSHRELTSGQWLRGGNRSAGSRDNAEILWERTNSIVSVLHI
jgi:hypothetical protein